MKKLILCFMCFACFANVNPIIPTGITSQNNIIGGCGAPMFFTQYDQMKIDSINHNARRIEVTYPVRLKLLASKIKRGLKNKNFSTINMKQDDLKDTSTVRYRHDAVVVTACFN